MSRLRYVLAGWLIWRPYYWLTYRQDLRAFMIRRRVWGGPRITRERRQELTALLELMRRGVDDSTTHDLP